MKSLLHFSRKKTFGKKAQRFLGATILLSILLPQVAFALDLTSIAAAVSPVDASSTSNIQVNFTTASTMWSGNSFKVQFPPQFVLEDTVGTNVTSTIPITVIRNSDSYNLYQNFGSRHAVITSDNGIYITLEMSATQLDAGSAITITIDGTVAGHTITNPSTGGNYILNFGAGSGMPLADSGSYSVTIIGGGAGVPEFSTNMYILVAIAGAWMFRRKLFGETATQRI